MKAEHRKELQTNVLADQMGKFIQGMKAKPSPTTLIIWVFVLVALGVFAGWRYYSGSSQRERSKLWVELDEAGSLEDLQNLAEAHPGTVPARVSRFQKARVLLHEGLVMLGSDLSRSQVQDDLKKAAELYEELAKESTDNPLLAQEALMGVARAKEALGDLPGAREYYEKLTESRYAKYPMGQAAAEHLKQLDEKSQDVQGFYAKLNELANAKPKPSAP